MEWYTNFINLVYPPPLVVVAIEAPTTPANFVATVDDVSPLE